jgi:hypothetical protein
MPGSFAKAVVAVPSYRLGAVGVGVRCAHACRAADFFSCAWRTLLPRTPQPV